MALEFSPDDLLCGVWEHQHLGADGKFVTTCQHSLFDGDTGLWVSVPAGFRSDGASFPRWMWSLYSPMGPWARAALFHDAAYRLQEMTREDADMIFWRIMVEDGVSKVRRIGFTLVLRLVGSRAWTKNTERIGAVKAEIHANQKRLHNAGLLIGGALS